MTERVSETDLWKLTAGIKWEPKSIFKQCDYCGGNGEVGGGFKSIDGPRTCDKCYGYGEVRTQPTGMPPDVPVELVAHMRKAWRNYFYPVSLPTDVKIVAVNDARDSAVSISLQVTEDGKKALRALIEQLQKDPTMRMVLVDDSTETNNDEA